jgi:hypothetical protein
MITKLSDVAKAVRSTLGSSTSYPLPLPGAPYPYIHLIVQFLTNGGVPPNTPYGLPAHWRT